MLKSTHGTPKSGLRRSPEPETRDPALPGAPRPETQPARELRDPRPETHVRGRMLGQASEIGYGLYSCTRLARVRDQEKFA